MSRRRRGCWSRRGCVLDTDVQHELAPAGQRRAAAAWPMPSTSWCASAANCATRWRRQVAEASRDIEQERSRLAALMSELTQSVVVCNLDGRILLYNQRARLQFRALSAAPRAGRRRRADRPGPLDLRGVRPQAGGARAGERSSSGLQRGAASPSAQFVTTTQAGQLLRAQMAPVRGALASVGARMPSSSGFVLMLDNITREFEQESAARPACCTA